jgi:hypothetical protein
MKNDFLTQFRKSPRREFATDLYQRINKPMPKQTAFNNIALKRAALVFGALALILFVTLLVSPPVRAFAGERIRQFGAIFLTPEDANSDSSGIAQPQPTIAAPPEITAEFVNNPTEAAELADFAVLAPAYLPDGYSENRPWSVDKRDTGVYVVSSYGSKDGRQFLIMNQTRFDENARFEQSYGDNETVTDVMIGANAGVYLTGRLMAHPDLAVQVQYEETYLAPTNWLIWEANGITYSLFGNGLDQDALVQIAESLTAP